jgi:N-acetyl-anhydromuramyl-L-alanine amidase AmpD
VVAVAPALPLLAVGHRLRTLVPPAPSPGALSIIQKPVLPGMFTPGHELRDAIVLHTMSGTLAGSDSWFHSNPLQVSAHFGVGLDGEVHQYVSLADTSHANGILEPGERWSRHFGADWVNDETVGIETEDTDANHPAHNAPVSDAEYASVLAVCQLVLSLNPGIHTLATHASISPLSRVNCPGPRWIASGRFAALASALGLQTLL